jgi:hypothetical protein
MQTGFENFQTGLKKNFGLVFAGFGLFGLETGLNRSFLV